MASLEWILIISCIHHILIHKLSRESRLEKIIFREPRSSYLTAWSLVW